MQIDDPILEMLYKARVDLINTYIHNQDIHAKSCVLLDVRVQLANEHHAILQRLNDVIDERIASTTCLE